MESNLVFIPINGSGLNLMTGNSINVNLCNYFITCLSSGETLYAPSLPATVKVSSKFGDHGDPRQLLVEGFLADPMTGFNNPTVVIRDILGRVVLKLEIKWKADFLHYIDVTSELNNVSIFKL